MFESLSTREVSRILATDKGWVGLSAERLRRRGYVSGWPDERDGRRTFLGLTEEGRKKHDAILAVSQWRQRRLLASLPDDAAATLIECLDRLQLEADRMLGETEAPKDAPAPAAKRSTKRATKGSKQST